jgi:two-component system sensor histidine kinase FlrB
MTALAQTLAGWPLALSMAATFAGQGLRAGRRRAALNRALHELRRPLQALALASGPRPLAVGVTDDPVGLAAAALDRLDREINGDPAAPAWGRIECRPLLGSAVGRWQARARIAECSLELRWSAGHAAVHGDRFALAQALDNLIVNAIEHGGCSIVVAARLRGGRLRVAVADSGRASRVRSRRESPAEAIARLSGRRRHGHGLAVVRRVAGAHGGRFALHRSERGSRAVLELPLAEEESGLIA